MTISASPPLGGPEPPVAAPNVAGAQSVAQRLPDPGIGRPVVPTDSNQHIKFDPEELQRNLRVAIEQMNKHLLDSGRKLGFTIDEALNRPIVTVRNTNTGEVIRQIPNEAVVKVAHTLDSLKGLLHDATI